MLFPASRRLRLSRLAAAMLPGLLFGVWYATSARELGGAAGFPLDDSWIHAQFARNLATGHGFTYTGGRWVSGSTAPAWTVLLAVGYLIVRDIVSAAYLLGMITQVISGYYAVRLTELLGGPRSLALLAGTFVVIMPVMTWGAVSGMEVPLAAALVLAGLYYHFALREVAGPRKYLGAALLGGSALARPESLAIAAVVLSGELFGRRPAADRVLMFGRAWLVCAAAVAPLVVFSYVTIDRPLPTTFYAKSGPGILRAVETRDLDMALRNFGTFGPRAVHNFWLILRDQLSWGAWLLVPAVAGLLAGGPGRRVVATLAICLVAVPYAMGLMAPQRLKPENVRYAAQLVVLAAPLLVAGTWRIILRLWPTVAIVVIAIGFSAWRTAEYLPIYTRSVKNIQELHVVTGKWLRDHLPADAVVAVNDVGAIAYYSGLRILDLEGLVSPEVLPYRPLPDRGMRVVNDLRPDFVVIFPAWYPEIAGSPAFREIHRVTIGDNLVSAGDALLIYETPWTARR